MFPRLHIHATPETIRIELEGTGVLIEEEAVLAVFFDARSEDAVCVGVGEDALKVPDQIRALEPTDDPTQRASLVPREKARWLEGNRGLGVAPVERREDPWAHHGECVILRPFAPGMGGARAWLWLIARPSLSLLAPGSPRRLGFAKRWWIEHAAPVHVVLSELPADDTSHDFLVRSLQSLFGGPVWLNGAPAKLRAPNWLPWRDWADAAGFLALSIAGAALAILGQLRLIGPPRAPLFFAIASVVCLGVAILNARSHLRAGPSEPVPKRPSSRSLRDAVGAPPDASPADHEGVAHYRFEVPMEGQRKQMPGSSSALAALGLWPFFIVALAFAAALAALAPPPRTCGPGRSSRDLSGLAAAALGISAVVGLGGSLVLGFWLAAPQLSLGERGLSLRLAGWYSRPVRIPYARVRHASISGFVLRLSFHGGQEVSLLLPVKESTPVQAIESEIVSRISSQASYRTPGRG